MSEARLIGAVDALVATVTNQGRQLASVAGIVAAQTEMLAAQTEMLGGHGQMLNLLLDKAGDAQEPGPLHQAVQTLIATIGAQSALLERAVAALERLDAASGRGR